MILPSAIVSIGVVSAFAGKIATPKTRVTPLNPSGNISAVSVTVQIDPSVDVDPTPTQLPNTFALQQNYPNPFNSSTNISYSCAKEGHVTLKVFNILGQEVATLVAGQRKPGLYSLSWNSRDKNGSLLPSGVYFYRLATNWFVETKKLVILR